jgi:hypothetical protein
MIAGSLDHGGGGAPFATVGVTTREDCLGFAYSALSWQNTP